MYVDGIVGDIGHGVLRDRKALSEEGVVVVILTVDTQAGEVVTGPRSSRAAGSTRPKPKISSRTPRRPWRRRSTAPIAEGALDLDTLRRHARRSLGKFIDERTRRRPIVIPVVMEV